MVDKFALGQVFLGVLRFSPVSVIPNNNNNNNNNNRHHRVAQEAVRP
jgi:hypothetical protein